MPKRREEVEPELVGLPERLRLAREAEGLGARELDRASGLGTGAVTRLSKGDRLSGVTAAKIIRLARALNVRPEWLLTGNPPMRDDGEWILVQASAGLLEALRQSGPDFCKSASRRK